MNAPRSPLTDRTALITGASAGIGRTDALRQAAAQAWGDFVVNVVNPLIDQANNRRFLGGCCDNPNCNGNTP